MNDQDPGDDLLRQMVNGDDDAAHLVANQLRAGAGKIGPNVRKWFIRWSLRIP